MGIAAVLAFWILWDCCFEPYEIHTQCEIEKGGFHPKYLSVMLQPAFPVRFLNVASTNKPWCFLCLGTVQGNDVSTHAMFPHLLRSELVSVCLSGKLIRG